MLGRDPACDTRCVSSQLEGDRGGKNLSIVAIGAHPDDVELMALPEIAAALERRCTLHAVVCCDGAAGDGERSVIDVRRSEARAAAAIGGFDLTLLERESSDVRGAGFGDLVEELRTLVAGGDADVVLTHAPTDRHPTHVAVCAAVVEALRAVPTERRPARLFGREVWGSLDWLGADAVRRDIGQLSDLLHRLLGAHQSQLAMRPFDAAARGRAVANAVFFDPREPFEAGGELLALDLTPAIEDGGPSLRALVEMALQRHSARVDAALRPYSGRG